jgi:hypothetical protein
MLCCRAAQPQVWSKPCVAQTKKSFFTENFYCRVGKIQQTSAKQLIQLSLWHPPAVGCIPVLRGVMRVLQIFTIPLAPILPHGNNSAK